MANRAEQPKTERVTPPRFGRNVERPRVLHALEVVEDGDSVLDQIDRLINLAAPEPTTAVA